MRMRKCRLFSNLNNSTVILMDTMVLQNHMFFELSNATTDSRKHQRMPESRFGRYHYLWSFRFYVDLFVAVEKKTRISSSETGFYL